MSRTFRQGMMIAVATTAMALGGTAMADGAQLYTEKACASCHGADAKTPIQPNYPIIAGQNKEYAEQQMKDIKSGARNNGQTAAMKAIMANVSEEEIPQLAEYISTLKPNCETE